MNKKTTTTIGIALGAVSLLAGVGYGLYKYFSGRRTTTSQNGSSVGGGGVGNRFASDFIGNSLVKSNSLYGSSMGDSSLIGGGLTKAMSGI